jgi:hypothetical protein
MRRYLIAAAAFAVLLFPPKSVKAEVYDRHDIHSRFNTAYPYYNNYRYSPALTRARPNRVAYRVERRLRAGLRVASAGARPPAQIIGGRPSGCPSRFCGCALSLKLFGKIIPRLNLAANWKAFPSAAPAPGMVAARHGHVFQLLSHVRGNIWVAWDANSGRGLTRIHHRSIAGFTIHNPNGSMVSQSIPPKRYAKRKYRRYAWEA